MCNRGQRNVANQVAQTAGKLGTHRRAPTHGRQALSREAGSVP